MMDIPKLRLLNQQLANPLFHSPKELVSWMGAVQAQDYAMAKGGGYAPGFGHCPDGGRRRCRKERF